MESTTPQRMPPDAEIDRLLDTLKMQHISLCTGTGYDPENYSTGYSEAADMIRALRSNIASETEAKDAARYRWLREHWNDFTGTTWRDPSTALDGAIDKAMDK